MSCGDFWFGKVLAWVPFGTFVGAVTSANTPALHPAQVFGLVCGGLASLAVCAYHLKRFFDK